MKRLVLLMAVLASTACSTLGVPAPQSCKQGVVATVATISTVRDLSTTLLQAKKINVSDHANIEKQADAVREGAVIARGLCDASPEQGLSRLEIARASLASINSYLIAQQARK